MEMIVMHMKSVKCPICSKSKRCLINIQNGVSNIIKCDCGTEFQISGIGKCKIFKRGEGS